MTDPESPASTLWRDTFAQVLRTNPRTDYEHLIADGAKAANLAVTAYRNAFPVPVASITDSASSDNSAKGRQKRSDTA